jgi:hypothetical protein
MSVLYSAKCTRMSRFCVHTVSASNHLSFILLANLYPSLLSLIKTMTCKVSKFHNAIGTAFQQCVSGIGNISMGWKIGHYQRCVQLWKLVFMSQILYKMAPTLKGLSHERGWAKSSENLGASPFKSDLSIDTAFSQINLARQFLKGTVQRDLRGGKNWYQSIGLPLSYQCLVLSP